MPKKTIFGFGTHADSMAGSIGAYGGGDTPSNIHRGVLASEVGIIGSLKMFTGEANHTRTGTASISVRV